jgi:general secretion pathway protein A
MLYLSEGHREALAALCYGILERKGLVLLLGHAGTGKTTLLTCAMERLPQGGIQFAIVVNPTNDTRGFLESVLLSFGIRDIPGSRPRRLALLEKHLIQLQTEGKIAVLIVDEAHRLSSKALEEVRLLGNLEARSEKLMQIILAGQNELRDLLNREACVQLKQRVALRVALRPLTPPEVGHYITSRWSRASGGPRTPFSIPAVELIARLSDGVPRVINTICDNALLVAFGDQSATVESAHVTQSCVELDLAQGPAEAFTAGLLARKTGSEIRKGPESQTFTSPNKWAVGS